jgi:hypothetical protein
MSLTTRKSFIVVAIVLTLLAVLFGRSIGFRLFPTLAFRQITGRPVPPGVRITAYASEVTDNLFHTTHYWMLAGSPSGLRQVIVGTGFGESVEDARGVMPDMNRLFGVHFSSTQVVAGYEWELAHDRWYYIFTGETNALYAH